MATSLASKTEAADLKRADTWQMEGQPRMESPKFLSLVWRWAQTGSGECWVPFGMGEHPASDCAAHPVSPGVMEMPQELCVFAPHPQFFLFSLPHSQPPPALSTMSSCLSLTVQDLECSVARPCRGQAPKTCTQRPGPTAWAESRFTALVNPARHVLGRAPESKTSQELSRCLSGLRPKRER